MDYDARAICYSYAKCEEALEPDVSSPKHPEAMYHQQLYKLPKLPIGFKLAILPLLKLSVAPKSNGCEY
jgi:hypothetical protein